MKKDQYTCDEVEKLLYEIAEQERRHAHEPEQVASSQECLMDDAMTQHLLAIFDTRVEPTPSLGFYKFLARCAVLVLVFVGGICFLLSESSHEQSSSVAEPLENGLSVTRQQAKKRTLLSHLDATTEAGFSPAPQETYKGNDRQRYGVSVLGNCEYTACTDTL